MLKNNTINFYDRLKQNKIMASINKFIISPYATIFLSLITLCCHVFSLELFFYIFICSYGVFVALFSDNLIATMPIFIFCYLVPSQKNNPGIINNSVFYGGSGTAILILGTSVFVALFVRIIFDKNMGIKRFFTTKRSLTIGMLILGLSYMLSGIGRPNYFAIFKNNFVCISTSASNLGGNNRSSRYH